MKLINEDVLHIAKLSRLHIDPEQIEAYKQDLGAILSYVEKLQELDIDDVPEMQHVAGTLNVWREDEVKNCNEETRKRAVENFTHKNGDLLKVQAVFDN